MRARNWFLLVGAAFAVGLAAPPSPAAVHPGVVLSEDNWQEARGLLPEEILRHYERGEYRTPVVEIDEKTLGRVRLPPDFQAASRANRDRYRLTEAGTIVDAKTGEPPPFLMGLPFPDIEPNDPQAALKIMWNHFLTIWYRSDTRLTTELWMIATDGSIDRKIRTDVTMRMYDGSNDARGRENPEGVFYQTLARVVWPADLNGIVSLSWRYRRGDMPDASWTYVPGLRRVRQVDPLNRSDGFLGSDLSLDDGAFFDAKPEDFEFRLLGREDGLVLFDPYALRGEVDLRPAPRGGWRVVWRDAPRIGLDNPEWKGLPWAPQSAVLAQRPLWIVEARPRDPNYLYSRLILRIDAETYHGCWVSKYDRAGELVHSYQIGRGIYVSGDGGKTWVGGGGVVTQIGEQLQLHRATAVLFPRGDPQNPSDFHVPTDPGEFEPDVLVRYGR